MATAIVRGGLTLYPGRSLVQNAGMDDSGTHGNATDIYDTSMADRRPSAPALRGKVIPIEPDLEALDSRRVFHLNWRRAWGLKFRVYDLIARLLPRKVEKALYTTIIRRSIRRMGRVLGE